MYVFISMFLFNMCGCDSVSALAVFSVCVCICLHVSFLAGGWGGLGVEPGGDWQKRCGFVPPLTYLTPVSPVFDRRDFPLQI